MVSSLARLGVGRLIGLSSYSSLPPPSRDEARASSATAGYLGSFIDEYGVAARSISEAGELVDLARTPLMPWLQDFSLGYTYGPTEVRAQIDAAAQLGVPDWLLWNANARYTTGALSPSLVRVRP